MKPEPKHVEIVVEVRRGRVYTVGRMGGRRSAFGIETASIRETRICCA